MNTFKQLREKWFSGVKSRWSNEIVNVFLNPSKKEINEILKNSFTGDFVRGFLLENGNMYLWGDANHDDMKHLVSGKDKKTYIPFGARVLLNKKKIHIFLSQDIMKTNWFKNFGYTIDYTALKVVIENHRQIKRNFSNVGLSKRFTQ